MAVAIITCLATLFAAVAAVAAARASWLEWVGKQAYLVLDSFIVESDPPEIPTYRWAVRNYGSRPAREITLLIESWNMLWDNGLDPPHGPVTYKPDNFRPLQPYKEIGSVLKADPWAFRSPNELPPNGVIPFELHWDNKNVPSQGFKVTISYRDIFSTRRGAKGLTTNVSYHLWGGLDNGKIRFPVVPMSSENSERLEQRLSGSSQVNTTVGTVSRSNS